MNNSILIYFSFIPNLILLLLMKSVYMINRWIDLWFTLYCEHVSHITAMSPHLKFILRQAKLNSDDNLYEHFLGL